MDACMHNESSCVGVERFGTEPRKSVTAERPLHHFKTAWPLSRTLFAQQWRCHTSAMKMVWKSPFVDFFLLSAHGRNHNIKLVRRHTVLSAMSHWWQRQNLYMGVLFLRLVSSLFQQSLLFHLAGRSFTSFPESCCPSHVWLGWKWSQTGSKYVYVCVRVCLSVVLSVCVCVCTVH